METHDAQPDYQVQDAEFRRLLGYPPSHEPDGRVRDLMAGARDWYARHGRPWTYHRRVELQSAGATLQLDGVEFPSARLLDHLRAHGAVGAVLVAVSAGAECETQARQLWQEGKPDEYFFLETYGSAVVEDLIARTSGRLCDAAGHDGLMAVPHYSPGYAGWDVAEQNRLFDLLTQGLGHPLPGPLQVLSSGMLNPKKSMLAVFGLAPVAAGRPAALATPCEGCSFSPCRYRRAPYRQHAALVSNRTLGQSEPGRATIRYTVNARALRKWAAERVHLIPQPDGTLAARFRFDGTTCSNQPLAFDYHLRLSGAGEQPVILEAACTPAPEDEGHSLTCSYLADGADHLRVIAAECPLQGQPLEAVFGWAREPAPAGCHCAAASRAHKWGLALEAIHFALSQARVPQPVA
ncbi:Vitamin B12 dependent methionine synthase, activation domain [Lacunisphaera limnophila]|uniref:Vitamin B12 dependent methionine synthase, activation domain n=1 Tax=Lacunisphaera limnophila TaxID=1838286 RepID=A0A1D8ARQ8_9BACT|nr:hypothetical protein [Lacunisphaera limnophila]AOS43584.1 Vitamin B12 dependent methionine synthase, activation domain [Lacunisphaera limnophila]